MKRLFWLVIVVVLGCAPAVMLTKFGPLPNSPQTGEVDVYTSAENIKRQYTEVALITVDDGGYRRSDPELLELLISKAKAVGADGVIILSVHEYPDGGIWAPFVFSQFERKVVRGSAVVYKKDADGRE